MSYTTSDKHRWEEGKDTQGSLTQEGIALQLELRKMGVLCVNRFILLCYFTYFLP